MTNIVHGGIQKSIAALNKDSGFGIRATHIQRELGNHIYIIDIADLFAPQGKDMQTVEFHTVQETAAYLEGIQMGLQIAEKKAL